MRARIRKLLADLGDAFWLLPAVLVALGILIAEAAIQVDRRSLLPTAAIESGWLYSGGATGARTLLGAVASSTIGVAGTVFSITIAALALASSQMGPRLLRNFTSDRGNQATLGVFLGTFAYALTTLRTVRTKAEGEFIPHVSLTLAVLLAFVCVAMLVYFVQHIASRINLDTLIDIVHDDVHAAIERLTVETPPATGGRMDWQGAVAVRAVRQGYLQQLDQDGLADWAAAQHRTVQLLIRPGDYVFPDTPIALVLGGSEGAQDAIRNAIALGPHRVGTADLEFAVRQLVEVAVRALSPGINDPDSAINVIDRLGGTLCVLSSRHLPGGAVERDGRVVLTRSVTTYDGLCDLMFDMIRQNAAASPAVLIHLLEVLALVASCEGRRERVAALRRHGGLVLMDGEREIGNPADVRQLRERHDRLLDILRLGPEAAVAAFIPRPARTDE